MHNRSGSLGGSPAPQGSPIPRMPMQGGGGGINPNDLMGNPNVAGPGSSAGSPAFSHSNMSRPGTAGLNHDGSRPATPLVGTPGSSGSFTPGGSHVPNLGGMVNHNHARQGSMNNGSPMMMNGFPPNQQQQQPHHDPSQQNYQQQNPYQNFNPQSQSTTMMGMNYSNQNGLGNPNPNPYSQQQQQRQVVNNLQSLPPHLQQQMAQQISSMNANGSFQGMNGMNPNAAGGIDMNSMMGNYQPQYQQNPNQWNNGR